MQSIESMDRRTLLQNGAGLAASLTSGGSALAAVTPTGIKPIKGLFPIGQTPFTPDDKIDLDCLAAEVRFCNRGRVAGFIWPQIASSWSALTEQERLQGAETILAAGKGGKTALVIGVQSVRGDLDESIRYAKHAYAHGADGIVSLPPENATDAAMLGYYKAIGAATPLPLYVQTIGDMSVDLVVQMYEQIPTMRCVKDEAGDVHARIPQIKQRTGNKLAIFAGHGVREMITEMRLDFTGYCPTTGLSDVYQSAFDLWHAGNKTAAFDMFGRILAFVSIEGADGYALVARGVFKETTTTRARPAAGGSPAAPARPPLPAAQRIVIREAMNQYLKPYLRA